LSGEGGRMPQYLIARHPRLERDWPFVQERLLARLKPLGEVRVVEVEGSALSSRADLTEVDGVALFGGRLTEECLTHAPRLRAVGVNTDNTGHGLPLAAFWERGGTVVETTAAWGQSVAEIALSLALAALRRLPRWHMELARGERSFEYEAGQYCDATGFANGELGTKRVGVIGLGQIGGRMARWCVTLGRDAATGPDLAGEVLGCDPFLPDGVAEGWGVRRVEMDEMAERSEVVFVTVPPTPSARHLLNRERLARLPKGALVVVVTRAHAVDMAALRERVVANELAAALDVFDVEPLPLDDPLRGRDNVVHLPHIAGRTRDANLRVADIIADDFARVLAGERARYALTPAMVRARTGA
jgi:phosphoglycerate dehydrogenase-like enzyme